jgi:hypothetical protein
MAAGLEQIDRHTGRRWDDCESFKEWARDTVKDLSPDLVVVSTHAGRVIDPATGDTLSSKDGERYLAVLEDGWTEYFEQLDADAGRVYVVGNTPKLPRETGVCLSLGNPDLGDCTFRPGRYSIRQAEVSFDAAEAAGVGAVDALKWFCADNRCPSVVGSYITMRDSEHMTPDYSRWLAEPLAAALGVSETRNAAAAGAH